MSTMRFLLLLITFCVYQDQIDGQSEPLVTTALGKIKGSVMSSLSGHQFLAFRGIRYANPPIGELRFQDPVQVDSWGGVFDATHEGPTCMQFDGLTRKSIGTEDCLVLNVYTRSLTPDNGLRPVMVWIHGGGFIMGSGNGETYLYGPKYLMDKDIVLITINYRLGPFGFFTTGTNEAAGNYGLLDQTMALKWVNDHVHHFGGNPESVTIFGESAGGASVHYHILSPRSKGLFQRAIAQSGTSLCPWAMPEALPQYSSSLAKKLGCLQQTPKEQLECLRTKKSADLISVPEEGFMPIMDFGPRVDSERQNPFLPAHPTDLLKRGEYNHVPLITGVTENEGLVFIGASGLLSSADRVEQFDKNPLNFIKHFLTIPDSVTADEISQKAKKKYLKENVSVADQLDDLEKMVSDFTFFKCTEDAIRYQLSHNSESIYYYFYTHHGQYTLPKLYGPEMTRDYGVCHGDELFLMFSSFLPPSASAEDSKVSEILIDLWTSFASQGKPISKKVDQWKPTTKEQTRYLNINVSPQMITGQLPFYQRLAFWDNIQLKSLKRDEL